MLRGGLCTLVGNKSPHLNHLHLSWVSRVYVRDENPPGPLIPSSSSKKLLSEITWTENICDTDFH